MNARSTRRLDGLVAAAAVVHVVLAYLMMTRRLAFLFTDAFHLHRGMDLEAYVSAANYWSAGEGIYGHGPGFGYRYHPLFAIVLSFVLRIVPHPHVLWVVIHEACLAMVLFLVRKLTPEGRAWQPLGAVLLVFSPFFVEEYMGNTSFLTAGVLLLAYAFDTRDNHVAVAALVVLACILKPLGILYLPVLFAQRRYKSLAAVCVALALTAAPHFLAHPRDFRTFVAVNVIAMPGWVVHAGALGFHGFVTTVLVRASGIPSETLMSLHDLPLFSRLVIGLVPVVLVAVSAVAQFRIRDELGVSVFLWCATILLGYKDIWEHTYSFVVVGLVCLWLSEFVSPRLVLACAALLALPTLFALYDVVPKPGEIDPESNWTTPVAVFHHASKWIGLMILYVACVRRALTMPRTVLQPRIA